MMPDVATTSLRTHFGEFQFSCFRWGRHEEDNVLVLWCPSSEAPLVRIQSACYTAEIFRSTDCDCHDQLETSIGRIAKEGGFFVYMLCDGRGAGLFNKVQALELTRKRGLDTAAAYQALRLPLDPRDYTRPAEVLRHLGVTRCRLLTNNPRKVIGLQSHGIRTEREPLEVAATPESEPYLRAKAKKLGHLLQQFSTEASPS